MDVVSQLISMLPMYNGKSWPSSKKRMTTTTKNPRQICVSAFLYFPTNPYAHSVWFHLLCNPSYSQKRVHTVAAFYEGLYLSVYVAVYYLLLSMNCSRFRRYFYTCVGTVGSLYPSLGTRRRGLLLVFLSSDDVGSYRQQHLFDDVADSYSYYFWNNVTSKEKKKSFGFMLPMCFAFQFDCPDSFQRVGENQEIHRKEESTV
jgi:hypothetical protein